MIEDMRPGRYLTRNGILVTVSESDDKLHPPFYWAGSAAGDVEVWDRHGRYYINGKESPLDLVARLPDEPPADDRIERAIRAIHQAQTEHYFLDPQIWSGGDLIKDTEVAELLANLRKILEGSDD